MSDSEAELASITEGVSSLNAKIEESTLESSPSVSGLISGQTTPAALLALPDELLVEIFSYGSSGPDDYSDVNAIAPNERRARSPFQRAAVSRQWRTAALSASPLWHYLLIPQTSIWSNHDTGTRMVLEYTELVLERSRSFPIDIAFQFIQSSPAVARAISPIFEALRRNQQRWRRFLARIHGRRAVNGVLRCLAGPTPQLRTVQIVQQASVDAWGFVSATNEYLWQNDDLQDDVDELVDPHVLTDAPALGWLSIVNLPDLPGCIKLSAASDIYSIEFICGTWGPSFWPLLRISNNVRRLMFGSVSGLPAPEEPILMPKLRRIWLLEGGARVLAEQPDLLLLPELRTISMVYGSFAGLEGFFTGVGNVLRYIDLQLVEGLAEIDIEVLASLPRINQLRLTETAFPEVWLERLCQTTVIMWPKLDWMTLDLCKVEEVQNGRLVELARMRGGVEATSDGRTWTPSICIRLGSGCNVPDEQIEQIAQLCTRFVRF